MNIPARAGVDKARAALSPAALEKQMARVEIYTSMFCGYCALAKRLLDGKSVDYEEFDVGLDGSKRAEMIERADGRTSVPQIFIDGAHVGGCDDLQMLDLDGRLDPMLGP